MPNQAKDQAKSLEKTFMLFWALQIVALVSLGGKQYKRDLKLELLEEVLLPTTNLLLCPSWSKRLVVYKTLLQELIMHITKCCGT